MTITHPVPPRSRAVGQSRRLGLARRSGSGRPTGAKGRGGISPPPLFSRNRGGFSSPIHSLADQRGRPLRLRLTGGQRHDSTQARALVKAWPCLIADRTYDRAACRARLAQRDIEAVLPARLRRLNPQPHDPEQYPARNAVERGIGWLKHGRRVVPRGSKYEYIFFLFIWQKLGSG